MSTASTSSNRAPLVLLLVVAAGFGVRAATAAHSPAGLAGGSGGGSAVAPLDSQLSRVRAAGGRPAPKSKRTKKGSAAPAPTTEVKEGEVRSERTPYGALPAERLATEPRGGPASPRTPRSPRSPRSLTEPSGSIVNLETATATEIETLPRIGPALARRIVEDRRAHGPFGSLAGLQRVRGVGPALAERIAARVTFNEAGRP